MLICILGGLRWSWSSLKCIGDDMNGSMVVRNGKIVVRNVYPDMWDNLGYGESTPRCIGDDICGCTSVSLHHHFQWICLGRWSTFCQHPPEWVLLLRLVGRSKPRQDQSCYCISELLVFILYYINYFCLNLDLNIWMEWLFAITKFSFYIKKKIICAMRTSR